MNKKEIKKEVIRQYRSAKKALRVFIKKGRQEDLHLFRGAVKKLRALAELMSHAAPKSQPGHIMHPIRKTYKLSGQIRDRYQYLGLGKEAHADAGHLAAKEKQMKGSIARFKRLKHKHLKRLRQARRTLIKNLKAINNPDLNLFYEQELRALAGLFNTSSNDNELHQGRKRLKVLLFNLPLMRHSLILTINEDYLDAVQTAIGNWHDMALAAKAFPALAIKAQTLRKQMQSQTVDFYNRATQPV